MMEIIGFLDKLHWREPLWLLLALQPALLFLLQFYQRKNQIDAYAEPQLQPWVVVSDSGFNNRTQWRTVVLFLAWILFAIAAAGPREILQQNGTSAEIRGNIFLLVDISKSMQANDTQPNRLRRAQIEIDELLSHAPDHRFGIILFAGRAHLYVPLTSDYAALRHYLDTLEQLTLPTLGSQPGSAVEMANRRLQRFSQPGDIIMLTDGDMPLQKMTKKPAFPLHVLGLGSGSGSAIQTADGGWLEHQGEAVVTRMDEPKLQNLATEHHGRFSRVKQDNSDWQQIYDLGIAPHQPAKSIATAEENTLWQEYYSWFLVPALILFLLSLMPSYIARSTATPTLLLIILVTLQSTPQTVRANDLQKTYELYSQQDYAGALKRYRQMVDFQGRLGEGASHYRMGNYDKAAHSFINAVLIAENDTDRATALFNLGNSYFQIGDYAKASSVFGDVLRYKPGHEAGAFNQSFSRSLQIAVEQRIQRKASRSGSGPRSAEAPQGLTVGENSSLSISEEKEQEKQSLPLPNLPQEKLERLIARGLEQVQFAAGGNKKRKRFERQERELALVDARLRMNDQQDNQDALWKRLFEMEEGFPAPLEQPKPIPGVKPW